VAPGIDKNDDSEPLTRIVKIDPERRGTAQPSPVMPLSFRHLLAFSQSAHNPLRQLLLFDEQHVTRARQPAQRFCASQLLITNVLTPRL